MTEEDIFHEALARATPEERAAYLDQACAGNPELRASVAALLEANIGAGGFLERALVALDPTGQERAGEVAEDGPQGAEPRGVSEGPGIFIGRYRLLEEIGEGGMGTVWMAQQTEPVKRLVAVKLIKAGMDSKQVLARFEAERQALAVMDHPNIAKVHDAGATSDGRPFFVMELVKGVPITRYCDEHRLTPRQRLELFVPVCAAIQHAHQKGIIHRDIKPSNVLVARYDDRPVPKVIDFGVAKATGQQLTDQSLHTAFGAVVGTVEYMSPEQASCNQLDVDTRSDLYSLGVLLYELLAGSPPFSRKELEKAGVLEMLRMIREQEPSKPSTKLSTADGLPTLAANRGTEPKRLTALVRGELDWIVMKALEKDRSRRYDTANGFALDVLRYLADEPVQACPPSAGYRLRKFGRRNKAAVLTGAVVTGALLLAVAVLAASYVQINGALADRDMANGGLREALVERDGAIEDLKAQKRDAEKARDHERYTRAVHTNLLAHRELLANNLQRAESLLDECPPELRQWEWLYLKRLCHPDLLTFRGHKANVTSVAFSPDGKWLASATGVIPHTGNAILPGEIKIWDATTGRVVHSLRGQTGGFQDVAFSPDGTRLASAGEDTTVTLWDTADGRPVLSLKGHTNPVTSVAFSPDGKLLASASGKLEGGISGDLKLWELATGKEALSLVDEGTIMTVAFSITGRYLVSVSDAAARMNVKKWDAKTGQVMRAANFFQLFPSSSLSTMGSDFVADAMEYGPAGNAGLYTANLRIWGVALSPKGKHYAQPFSGGTVKVLVGRGDGVDVHEEFSLRGHTRGVNQVTFSPDGRRLASASYDETVKVWSMTTSGESLTVAAHVSGTVSQVAFSPDGGRLASVGGNIQVWDRATGQSVFATKYTDDMKTYTRCVAFSPDGRYLAAVNGDNTVTVWDLSKKDPPIALQGHTKYVYSVGFSPDGRRLVSASKDETIKVWDWITGREAFTLPGFQFQPGIGGALVAFSPDGKRLASYWRQGRQFAVRVWDAATGQGIHTLRKGFEVTCLAFSPDGRWLATGYEGLVKLWDPESGREMQTLLKPGFAGPAPHGLVNQWLEASTVGFSPDGRWLACGFRDGTVVFWDPETGQQIRAIQQAGRFVAFTPDGKRIATIGSGQSVRMWDPSTGQEVLTLTHTRPVTSLAFSPNGKHLATGSGIRVQIWSVEPLERESIEASGPARDNAGGNPSR